MRAKNRLKRLTVLGALALATAALAFTPAIAGGRHHRHGKDRHHKVHRVHHPRPHRAHHGHAYVGHGRYRAHHGRAHVHAGFVIPGHIGQGQAGYYRPYYHGRTYFRPHRHDHTVYYFPVHTSAGYVWRPHAYCNGRLLTGYVAYRGPDISFSVSF